MAQYGFHQTQEKSSQIKLPGFAYQNMLNVCLLPPSTVIRPAILSSLALSSVAATSYSSPSDRSSRTISSRSREKSQNSRQKISDRRPVQIWLRREEKFYLEKMQICPHTSDLQTGYDLCLAPCPRPLPLCPHISGGG